MAEGQIKFFQNNWGKIKARAATPEIGEKLIYINGQDVIVPEEQQRFNDNFIRQKYKSLTQRYKDQPESECFARFLRRKGESWQVHYEELAKLAKPEEWNFKSEIFRKAGQHFPILTNYLNYTFLRAQDLELIVFSTDENNACFNTGLQTDKDKDIYATFYRQKGEILQKGELVKFELATNDHGLRAVNVQKKYPGPSVCLDKWIFNSFEDSYSDRLSPYKDLPGLPTYITDASDLVFDVEYEIDVNLDHIIDDRDDRLPKQIRENPRLAISAIEGAIRSLKSQVARNYKIAIPHWYNGKVQLLLPLKITSDEVADLALVADKDKERGMYRIRTVLTMDKAFINARL